MIELGKSSSPRKFMPLRRLALAVFAGAVICNAPLYAEDEPLDLPENIDWQIGPVTGQMGGAAQIELPEGYVFTGPSGTIELMEMMENPTSGTEVGFVSPPDMSWFAVFEFDDIGYVKDDDKDSLDAEAMLESIREGTEASNAMRRERGWSTMEIVGWEKPPYYDTATNNLVWAIRGKSDDGLVVNYNTRRLGRSGVMSITLVVDPELLPATIPEFESVMTGYGFVSGQKYSEFRSGDKIAEYGLAALVTGGAAAIAMKTGLFKYLWKIIVGAVVVIGGVFKKFFGGGTKSAT